MLGHHHRRFRRRRVMRRNVNILWSNGRHIIYVEFFYVGHAVRFSGIKKRITRNTNTHTLTQALRLVYARMGTIFICCRLRVLLSFPQGLERTLIIHICTVDTKYTIEYQILFIFDIEIIGVVFCFMDTNICS